jgi:type I restriction enzyme, R subunit
LQARAFAELLEQTVRRYQNGPLETSQLIEERIRLAKDMRQAAARGESMGLNDDEVVFYDALEVNDSAVKVLGEPMLKDIGRELVATVKKNVTIDWTIRENVRAQLRVLVKQILRKYGYPPDKQEKTTQTVLEQAESPLGGVGGSVIRCVGRQGSMFCSFLRDGLGGLAWTRGSKNSPVSQPEQIRRFTEP